MILPVHDRLRAHLAHVLTTRYALALREHGCEAQCLGAEATWRGLWAIARELERT